MSRLLAIVILFYVIEKPCELFARESKVQRKANALAVRKMMMAAPRIADALELNRSSDQEFEVMKGSRRLVMEKLSGASAKKFESLVGFLDQSARNEKIDSTDFLEKTGQLEQFTIRMFDIESAPALTPQRQLGEAVYQGRCVMCHGTSGEGDGPLSKKLKPAPFSFTNKTLSKSLSAFRIYNILITGIPNSTMKAFDEQLSEDELWSVAFWVMELTIPRFGDAKKCNNPKTSQLSLREISVARNFDLSALSNDCIALIRTQLSYDTKRAR